MGKAPARRRAAPRTAEPAGRARRGGRSRSAITDRARARGRRSAQTRRPAAPSPASRRGDIRAHRQHRRRRRDARRRARRAGLAAPVDARARGLAARPAPARARIARQLVEHGQRQVVVAARRARSIGRRRARPSVAEHQPRLDGAVPDVALQPEGGVDRLLGLDRRAARRSRTRRARALVPPEPTEKRRWRPSPIGRRSRKRAPGTSRRGRGLPMPHGSRRSSSSARSSPSSHPETIASTRSRGTSRSRGQDLLGVALERVAERVEPLAADGHARRGPVAAVALEVLGARVQPGQQVEAGDAAARAGARVSVEAHDHRGPVVALDDPRGDDPDDARGASRRRQHVGAALALLGAPGPRPPTRSAARPRDARR